MNLSIIPSRADKLLKFGVISDSCGGSATAFGGDPGESAMGIGSKRDPMPSVMSAVPVSPKISKFPLSAGFSGRVGTINTGEQLLAHDPSSGFCCTDSTRVSSWSLRGVPIAAGVMASAGHGGVVGSSTVCLSTLVFSEGVIAGQKMHVAGSLCVAAT